MKWSVSYIFTFFAFWFILSCKTSLIVNEKKFEEIDINHSIKNNAKFDSIINPYKKVLSKEMNRVIATSDFELTKEGLSSNLGNFLADILYTEATEYVTKNKLPTVDFLLTNSGGIRTTLKKGAVTVGDIYEIMPFENEIVIIKLSGEKIKELFNYLNTSKKGHPMSHLKVSWKKNKLIMAQINNQDFDESKSYFVATNDYLANGGDNMNFFTNPLQKIQTHIKIRDAYIIQIEKLKKIPNITEYRLIIEDE